MGSKNSKIVDENIKLREGLNLPWVKKLGKEHLMILARLQLEYMERFQYGLDGHDNCYVEVPAFDDLMEEIFEILPWGNKIDFDFLDSEEEREKNYQYYKQDLLKITTVSFEREDAKEFFSIFQNIQPKLEQMWIHLTQSKTIFKSIDEHSIEKIFYEGSKTDRLNFKRNLIKELFGEEDQMYTTKRVSIIFEDDNEELSRNMKLVYYHNARGLGNGYLRLHFSYNTYKNGKVNHLLPSQIYHKKKCSEDDIEIIENDFDKKRKRFDDVPPEVVKREMEEIREMIAQHKKKFYMGEITPEFKTIQYAKVAKKYGLPEKVFH